MIKDKKIISILLFIFTLLIISSSYAMSISDITYNKDTSFIVYSNITKDSSFLNVTTTFDNVTDIPDARMGIVVFNENGQAIASQDGQYGTVQTKEGYHDISIKDIELVPTNNTGTPYSFFLYVYDPSDYSNNASFVHVLNETEIIG